MEIHVRQKFLKNKFLFLIIFLVVFGISSVSFSSSNCPVGTELVLVFSNGMFNDKEDAEDSLSELINKTNSEFSEYSYAYNMNETPLLQLLEVFYQKIESDQKFLWSYFSKLNGPKWFTDFALKVSKEITKQAYVNDDNLKKHVIKYREYLDRKLGVISIPHSQGNFYVNRSYEYLREELNLDVSFVQIVAVATPDSYVAGKGEYRTLESDLLIKSIPRSLPSNVENINAGMMDHEFINHYLLGYPAGPQIVELIFTAAKKVSKQNFFFESGYLHKNLYKMNKWIKQLSKGLITRKLTKSECLATSLFIKNNNWFGMNCDERNLQTIKVGSEQCFKSEWSNSNQEDFSCQLYGLKTGFFDPWNSPKFERVLFANHEECRWEVESIHNELTSRVLQEALLFIQDPR